MTICVASSCDLNSKKKEPKIVMVTDRMLSTWTESSEIGRKIFELYGGWYAMFSANDMAPLEPLISCAQDSIRASDSKAASQEAIVAVSMLEAYKKTMGVFIQNRILSPFALSLEDFVKGNHGLRDAQYAELFAKINNFDLGCEFLVCGFSGEGSKAHIIHIHNPGDMMPCDIQGFAAIGSGAPNAFSHLMAKEQNPQLTFEEALYNAIGAKVMAESAMGVGKKTVVAILGMKSGYRILGDAAIEKISGIFKREERDMRPKRLIARMAKILYGKN